jgi:hypothetical protein
LLLDLLCPAAVAASANKTNPMIAEIFMTPPLLAWL